MNKQKSIIADQDFLLRDQYQNSSTLEVRKQLYDLFGVNKQTFVSWVFDRIEDSLEGHILEFGCGPATLWVENEDRIPSGQQHAGYCVSR